MRYDPIDNSLFKNNRTKFLKKMDPNSIAFNSNDNYPVSADTTLPFEQHRDIFYMTGVNQEKSILILKTNGPNESDNEFLFITKPNKTMIHWEGEKLNPKSAFHVSGIEDVFWLNDLNKKIDELMNSVENIYINNNEHYRANVETETRRKGSINEFKKIFQKNIKKSNPILQGLER